MRIEERFAENALIFFLPFEISSYQDFRHYTPPLFVVLTRLVLSIILLIFGLFFGPLDYLQDFIHIKPPGIPDFEPRDLPIGC
jgi:hypothetical protein